VSPDERTPILVLTGRALKVRRSVDPTAWLVLEELAIHSETASRTGTVSVEVLALADALGRSRDTVGRALQTLIEAGLVERRSNRDELTGQFGTATYRIDLAAAGLHVPAEPDAAELALPPRAPISPAPPRATPSPRPERLFEP
jgi:DNA-binding transcriptional MocR family regulator